MDGAFMAESAPPLRPNGNHHNLSAVTPTTTTTTTLTSPGGILGSFLRARPSRDPSDQRTSPNDLLRTPPTPSSGFSHILRRRRSGGQIAPNSPPVPPVPSRPAPSLPTSASVPNAPSLPVPTGSYTAPSTTTMPQQAPPAALSAANVTTALAGVGGPPTNAGDGPPGPSHRLRLVPQIDNRRSLRFDPISRDVPEGSAALRIGRFTDRSGLGVSAANALGSNKLAFKSKVVSRAHAEIWCERGGKFFIRDTRSSSGTFLNHVRLSAANADSRPFEIRDGDTLQLGVDYQGGAEDIYKCVRIRVEIGREWQAGANAFNTNALKQLRALSNPTGGKAAPDKKSAHTAVSHGKSGFSDCCICLFSVTIQQALFIAPCSHSFHYKCIRPLLESHHPAFSCPLCRTFADLEEDVEIEGGDGASLAPSAEAEEDDEEDKVSSAVAPAGLGRPGIVIPAPVLVEDDEDADDMDVYEDAQVPSSAPVLPASAASIRSIHSGHSIHSASQPSLHSHSHSHGHLPAHYDGFSHSFEGVARHGTGDGFDPYEVYSRPSMDASLAHSHSHSQGQEVDDDRMLGVPEEPAPAYDDIQGPGHRASPLNHIRSGGGGSGGLLATPRVGSAGYGDVPVDRRAESDGEEARDVLGSLGGEIRRRR